MLIDDASPADVASIRDLAVSIFGEGVSPPEVVGAFANAGEILKVVKRVITTGDDRRERFSGYFCVLPLSATALEDLKRGALRGRALTMEHLVLDVKRAAGLYVGAVAARDHYSRAIVLEGLRLHVNYLSQRGGLEVLTRPLTNDGLRLARKYGSEPLQNNGGLDELYILPRKLTYRNRH